jgi:hypothetical protein
MEILRYLSFSDIDRIFVVVLFRCEKGRMGHLGVILINGKMFRWIVVEFDFFSADIQMNLVLDERLPVAT